MSVSDLLINDPPSQAIAESNNSFIGYGSATSTAPNSPSIMLLNFAGDQTISKDIFVFNVVIQVDDPPFDVNLLHHNVVFSTVIADNPFVNFNLRQPAVDRSGSVIESEISAAQLALYDFILTHKGLDRKSVSIPIKGFFKLAPGEAMSVVNVTNDDRIRVWYEWFELVRPAQM